MLIVFIAESQASDEADRSTHQGFLSNQVPSGSDVSQSSLSDYDKFITPNFNRVKHGNGPFTTVDENPRFKCQGELRQSWLGAAVIPESTATNTLLCEQRRDGLGSTESSDHFATTGRRRGDGRCHRRVAPGSGSLVGGRDRH